MEKVMIREAYCVNDTKHSIVMEILFVSKDAELMVLISFWKRQNKKGFSFIMGWSSVASNK